MKQKNLKTLLDHNKALVSSKKDFLLGKPSSEAGVSKIHAIVALLVIAVIAFFIWGKFSGEPKTQTPAVSEDFPEEETDTVEEVLEPECSYDENCLNPEDVTTITKFCIKRQCREGSRMNGPCSEEHHCLDAEAMCIQEKCQEASRIGGPCSDEDHCLDAEAYCGPGGICTEAKQGAKCYEGTGKCTEDLVCLPGFDENRYRIWTCEPKSSKDGYCYHEDYHCEGDLGCNGAIEGTDGRTPSCQPIQEQGGRCDRMFARGNKDCNQEKGLVCNEGIKQPGQEDGGTCQKLQGQGGPCYVNSEVCKKGLRCYYSKSQERRMCQTPKQDGEMCSGDGECEDGSTCKRKGYGNYCVSPGGIGHKCIDNEDCTKGVCSGLVTEDNTNTCQLPQVEGEKCWNDNECGEDPNGEKLVCNKAITNENYDYTCQPLQDINGECRRNEECGEDPNGEKLVCNYAIKLEGQHDREGTCQERQADGGKCDSKEDCKENLQCLGGRRKAGECGGNEQAKGEKCNSNENCKDEYTCNTKITDEDGDPTCQPLQTQEGFCLSENDCQGELICTGAIKIDNKNTCQPRQGEGGYCQNDGQCEEKYGCNLGIIKDGIATCQLPQPEDEVCTYDNHCKGDDLFCNHGLGRDLGLDYNVGLCKPKQPEGGRCGYPDLSVVPLTREYLKDQCQSGLVCNQGMKSTCQLPQPEGGKCYYSVHCQEKFGCTAGMSALRFGHSPGKCVLRK
ncbi:hypothetical protein ACFL0W_02320 [Nanoarchaeota archaeon]